MNREELKELSIEFLNRAYELIELAETHPDDCPPESRYLSHGYSLKLENYRTKTNVYLILFRKNEDGTEYWDSELLVWLDILGNYKVNYGILGYLLNLYITRITNKEG